MTVSPELDRRFRDAAAAEGLLDVAYELHDTPVGELLVAVTERGVCEIHYDADPEAEADRLARLFGTRVLRSPRPTDDVRRQLDEYFAGRRQEFELEVDLGAARECVDVIVQLGFNSPVTGRHHSKVDISRAYRQLYLGAAVLSGLIRKPEIR